jgi:hypothetical protein
MLEQVWLAMTFNSPTIAFGGVTYNNYYTNGGQNDILYGLIKNVSKQPDLMLF